jgi:lipopolysaccharide biosynthesis glycosyltransferase
MLAVYAATRNLYWYLPTTVGSLLKHNPNWRVIVFCEDDEIDSLKDPRVSFMKMHTIGFPLDEDNPNMKTKYSSFTLVRCYLSKFLPNEKKILWIDADTCVVDTLEELDTIDITRKAVAGVMENVQPPPGTPEDFFGLYINCGVLVMNLDFIRQHGFDKKWHDLLSSRKFNYPDQDVINLTCKGFIKFLDSQYNFSHATWTGGETKVKIYHYVNQKIWNNGAVDFWRKTYIKKLGDEPELPFELNQ